MESAIIDYATRVYGNGDSNAKKDFVLVEGDFAVVRILQEKKEKAQIGFSA